MNSNRLNLNTDNTIYYTWFETTAPKVNCNSIRLGNVTLLFLSTVTCLVIILDAELTMLKHFRGSNSHSFYQLKQIRTVHKSLNIETAQLLVHAFVHNRLNYCNRVLQDVGAVHLQKLQLIQKGSARDIYRKR